jgi:hypothetical protein
VTEQGLGHDWSGLSYGVKVTRAPIDGRRGRMCSPSVTGKDAQVNASLRVTASPGDVIFVTLW